MTDHQPTPRSRAVTRSGGSATPWRGLLVVLLVAMAAAVLAVAPSRAVGASGVDMTPALERDRDGSFVLPVGGGDAVALQLSNMTDEPRDVRVYSASATIGPEPGSGATIGGPGTVAWAPLDASLTLAADETREVTVPVSAHRGDVADGSYLAFVLEVGQSASIVTEAATVVRVRHAATLPVAPWLATLAVLVLAVAAVAWLRFGRAEAAARSARPAG